MSKLSGKQILLEMEKGTIKIDPFDIKRLNPNSYNLRLDSELLVYDLTRDIVDRVENPATGVAHYDAALDMRKDNPTKIIPIPPEGFVLAPGVLYLGSTIERTETPLHVPIIEGRSGSARLGLSAHLSAGFGDHGFAAHWTLELTVVHPLRVYAGVEICQIAYEPLIGEPTPYAGKYQGQKGPQASRLWKEFGADSAAVPPGR